MKRVADVVTQASRSDEPTYAFIGGLVERHPLLAPLLSEHLAEPDGILTHTFISDVERWLQARTRDGQLELVTPIMATIEEQFSKGNDRVQGLLAVSFLWLIGVPGTADDELVGHLGPTMRHAFEAMHPFEFH